MPSIALSPPPGQEKDAPEVAALLAKIEEKALLREFTGRPGTPLVSRSISHRNPPPHTGPSPMGLPSAHRNDLISEGLPQRRLPRPVSP